MFDAGTHTVTVRIGCNDDISFDFVQDFESFGKGRNLLRIWGWAGSKFLVRFFLRFYDFQILITDFRQDFANIAVSCAVERRINSVDTV